jgi:two-component system, NtrC family, response regulator HydG
VEPGSLVRTDGWGGYGRLPVEGYEHTIIRKSADVGENLLPLVNRVLNNFRFKSELIMGSKSLLIVDDEAGHRQMLRAYLEDEGFQASEAPDGLQAVTTVQERAFDLVLLDLKMPGMDGLEALRRMRRISSAMPIIMMTAYGTIEAAVEAIKSGAQDFVAKPLDMEELTLKIRKVLHLRELGQESLLQQERLEARFDFSRIIGHSPKMQEIVETLALVAPTEATVLILGESGTGKELIADAVHQNSPRRQKPPVKLNCAALQESLLESELFDHEPVPSPVR